MLYSCRIEIYRFYNLQMSVEYHMKYLIENYWENAITAIVRSLCYFINILNLKATLIINISAKALLRIMVLSITMSRTKTRFPTMKQEYNILKNKLDAYFEVPLTPSLSKLIFLLKLKLNE